MKLSFLSPRPCVKLRRLFRLAVRTSPLHGEDTGSSPVKDKKKRNFFFVLFSSPVFADSELRRQFFHFCSYNLLFLLPYLHSKVSVVSKYTAGLQFLYEYEISLSVKILTTFYKKHLLWFKGLEEIHALRAFVYIRFGFYLGLRVLKYVSRKVLKLWYEIKKCIPGTTFYEHTLHVRMLEKKHKRLRLFHFFAGLIFFFRECVVFCLSTAPKKVKKLFGRRHVFYARVTEFCFVITYYLRYYFPLHFESTYLLINQMRKLRLLRTQLASWQNVFYSWSECRFFGRSIMSFLYGTCLVRYQDMKISEFWEIGYPTMGYRPSLLVNSMYQNDGYFLWSIEKTFEMNYYNVLEDYFFVPQYLRSKELVAATKPSAHLEAILDWLADRKANNQSTVVERVLDEIYMIFDEHFQIAIFEESLKDPLYLMRLHNFVPSTPHLHYIYDNGYLAQPDLAASLLFDPALIEKVCAHWEVTVHQSNYEVFSWATSPETHYVFSNTPFRDSLKIAKESTIVSQHATWLPEELVMRCQVFVEMFFFLYYQYFPVVRFHAYYDDTVYTGKDMFGALHPYFSLAGMNLHETLALPTTIVFFIMSYCYVRSAIIPVYREVGIQAEWYLKFRTHCMIYYKIDPDEEFANDFFHVFIFACSIPFYYDWMRLPWSQRHSSWRYDMFNYVKFVHRVRRRRHSYDPGLAGRGDWDGVQLGKEPSLLIPLIDIMNNNGRVRRKRRWQLTNRIGFYPQHSITYWNPSMRARFRKFRNRYRQPWGPGITHFEQNWILGLYRALKRDKQQRLKRQEDTIFGSKHMMQYAFFSRSVDWVQYKDWLSVLKKVSKKDKTLIRQARQKHNSHLLDVSLLNFRLGLMTRWERRLLAASHRFVKTDRMTAEERHLFFLDREAYYQYKSWTNQLWLKIEKLATTPEKPISRRALRAKQKKLNLAAEAKNLIYDKANDKIVAKPSETGPIKGSVSSGKPLLKKPVRSPLGVMKAKQYPEKGQPGVIIVKYGSHTTRTLHPKLSLWRGSPNYKKAMYLKQRAERLEAWKKYFATHIYSFVNNVGNLVRRTGSWLPQFKHQQPEQYLGRFSATESEKLREKYISWYSRHNALGRPRTPLPDVLKSRVFTNWVSRPQTSSIVDTTGTTPPLKLDLTLPSSTSWIIGPWRWTLPYETSLMHAIQDRAELERLLPIRAYNVHLSFQEKELKEFYEWAHLHWELQACLQSENMYRFYVTHPAHELPCGAARYPRAWSDEIVGDPNDIRYDTRIIDAELYKRPDPAELANLKSSVKGIGKGPELSPRSVSQESESSQLSLPPDDKLWHLLSPEIRHPFERKGAGTFGFHDIRFMYDISPYKANHIHFASRFQSVWRNRTQQSRDRLPFLLNQSHRYYATLFDRQIGLNWMAYLLQWDYESYHPNALGFPLYPCREYDLAEDKNEVPFDIDPYEKEPQFVEEIENTILEERKAHAEFFQKQKELEELKKQKELEEMSDHDIIGSDSEFMSGSDNDNESDNENSPSYASSRSSIDSLSASAVEVVDVTDEEDTDISPIHSDDLAFFSIPSDDRELYELAAAIESESQESQTPSVKSQTPSVKSMDSAEREDAEYKEQYYSSLALPPLPGEDPLIIPPEGLSENIVPFDPEDFSIQRSRFQNFGSELLDNLWDAFEAEHEVVENIVLSEDPGLAARQIQAAFSSPSTNPIQFSSSRSSRRRPLELLDVTSRRRDTLALAEEVENRNHRAEFLMSLERIMAEEPRRPQVNIDAYLPHSDSTTFEIVSPVAEDSPTTPPTYPLMELKPTRFGEELPRLADLLEQEAKENFPTPPSSPDIAILPYDESSPVNDLISIPGEPRKAAAQVFKARVETFEKMQQATTAAKTKHKFAMRPDTPPETKYQFIGRPDTPPGRDLRFSMLFDTPPSTPESSTPSTPHDVVRAAEKPPYAGPFDGDHEEFAEQIREVYAEHAYMFEELRRLRDFGETDEDFVKRQFFHTYDPSTWPMTDSGNDTALGLRNKGLAEECRTYQEMAFTDQEEMIPRLIEQRRLAEESQARKAKLIAANKEDTSSISEDFFESSSSSSESEVSVSSSEASWPGSLEFYPDVVLKRTPKPDKPVMHGPITFQDHILSRLIKPTPKGPRLREEIPGRDAINELAETRRHERIRFFNNMASFQPRNKGRHGAVINTTMNVRNAAYHENLRLRRLESRALAVYFHSYQKLWMFASGKIPLPKPRGRDLDFVTNYRLMLEFQAFYPLNCSPINRHISASLLDAPRYSLLDKFLLTQMLFDHTPETLFMDQYERISRMILPTWRMWQQKMFNVGQAGYETEFKNLEIELKLAWLDRLKRKYFLNELKCWETSWVKGKVYLPNLGGLYEELETFCGVQAHFDPTKLPIPDSLQVTDYVQHPALFIPTMYSWKQQMAERLAQINLQPYLRTYLDFDFLDCFYHRKVTGDAYGSVRDVHDNSIMNRRLSKIIDRFLDGLHVLSAEEKYHARMHKKEEEQPVFPGGWDVYRDNQFYRTKRLLGYKIIRRKKKLKKIKIYRENYEEFDRMFYYRNRPDRYEWTHMQYRPFFVRAKPTRSERVARNMKRMIVHPRWYGRLFAKGVSWCKRKLYPYRHRIASYKAKFVRFWKKFFAFFNMRFSPNRPHIRLKQFANWRLFGIRLFKPDREVRVSLRTALRPIRRNLWFTEELQAGETFTKERLKRTWIRITPRHHRNLYDALQILLYGKNAHFPYRMPYKFWSGQDGTSMNRKARDQRVNFGKFFKSSRKAKLGRRRVRDFLRRPDIDAMIRKHNMYFTFRSIQRKTLETPLTEYYRVQTRAELKNAYELNMSMAPRNLNGYDSCLQNFKHTHYANGRWQEPQLPFEVRFKSIFGHTYNQEHNNQNLNVWLRRERAKLHGFWEDLDAEFFRGMFTPVNFYNLANIPITTKHTEFRHWRTQYFLYTRPRWTQVQSLTQGKTLRSSSPLALLQGFDGTPLDYSLPVHQRHMRRSRDVAASLAYTIAFSDNMYMRERNVSPRLWLLVDNAKKEQHTPLKDFVFGHQYRAGLIKDINGGYAGKLMLDNIFLERLYKRSFLRRWQYYNRMRGQRRRDSKELFALLGKHQKESHYRFLHPKFWKKYYAPGLGYRFPGYLGYGMPGFPGAKVVETEPKYINLHELLAKIPEYHLQTSVVASAFGYQAFPTDSLIRDLAYSLKYTKMLPLPGRVLEFDGGFGGLAGDIVSPVELIFKIRETCAENQAKYKLLGILNNIAYLDKPTPDSIYNRFAFPTFIGGLSKTTKWRKIIAKDKKASQIRDEALLNLNRWFLYSRVLMPTEAEVATLAKLFNENLVPLIREEPKAVNIKRMFGPVKYRKLNKLDADAFNIILKRFHKFLPAKTSEDVKLFYAMYLDSPMDMNLLKSMLLSRSNAATGVSKKWFIGSIRDTRMGADSDNWRAEFPKKKPTRALYRPMRGHNEFPTSVKPRQLEKGRRYIKRYAKEIRKSWKKYWRKIEEPKLLADTPEAFVDFFGYQTYFKREQARVLRRVQRKMFRHPKFFPEFFFREKNTQFLRDEQVTLRLYRHLSRNAHYVLNQPNVQATIVREKILPAFDLIKQYTQELPSFVTSSFLLKYPELLMGDLGEHLKTRELRWRREEELARRQIANIRAEFMGKCTVEELNDRLEPYWEVLDEIKSARRNKKGLPLIGTLDRPISTEKVPLRTLLRLEHTWPAEVMRDWIYFGDAQAQASSLELYQEFKAEIAPEPVGLLDVSLIRDYYKLVSILHGLPYKGPTDDGVATQLPNFNLRQSRYQNQNWWMRIKHVESLYPNLEREWEEYTINRPVAGPKVTKYFERQRLVGGLRAGNLRDRSSICGFAEMEITYPQRWGWVAVGESHPSWMNPLSEVSSGISTRVRFMSDVDIWQGWRKTPMRTLNLRDQMVLSGLYNVLQPAPNPLQYLVQATSPTTPVDMYGSFCDDSLGKVPYQWFDIYDPTTGEIVGVNKTRYLAFSQGQYLRRYVGFVRGQGAFVTTHNVTNSFQHHESLITGFLRGEHIGAMEYMGTDIVNKAYDHLVNQFEQTEKLFGMEFAVTSMLKNYYGVIPKQVADFIVYGTYWGITWLNAIYQASFLELPLKQLDLVTPRDGMFDFGNDSRELEQRLRNTQRKYLYTSGLDYAEVLDTVLKKWERDIAVQTFFDPITEEDLSFLDAQKQLAGSSARDPFHEVKLFVNKQSHGVNSAMVALGTPPNAVPTQITYNYRYGYPAGQPDWRPDWRAFFDKQPRTINYTNRFVDDIVRPTVDSRYLIPRKELPPFKPNPTYLEWLYGQQHDFQTVAERANFENWVRTQPHFSTYYEYVQFQKRVHPDWQSAKNVTLYAWEKETRIWEKRRWKKLFKITHPWD